MAGLWESWRDPSGDTLRTFCVITTEPNAVMTPIHDRMPVLIQQKDWANWLDPGLDGRALKDLLRPMRADVMEAWPVIKRMNRTVEDDPSLMDSIKPEGTERVSIS